jgi:hypothetical protein
MRKSLTMALLLATLMVASAGAALAVDAGPITVDGVQYAATKVSGPTVHYETPDVNPSAASTGHHTWVGNGSENLPCEDGIHWIDNANVLTISHCLEVPDETTTTVPETTTTVPETTTTTVAGATTTVPEETTTTDPGGTTTSIPKMIETGDGGYIGEGNMTELIAVGALLALGLLTLGGGYIVGRLRRRELDGG